MFRISKLTDYATVVLTLLARDEAAIHSASGLAAQARLEPPTVSKLLKMLGQAGLVESFRGAHGGYRLARPAAAISVAEIVAAIEGPIGVTECAVHDGLCDHETHCGVRANWRRISEAVEAALRSVSLADMLDAPSPAPTRRIPSRLAAH
ncbi:MAG: transcriptional regulator [Lysobacteraceae bacterium]|nr:MAG: transcriptional regulator [Xanthomonadaceae bacterium]